MFLESERGSIGRLRILEPARVAEQDSQVVMASGQLLAEFGPGGEVSGQLLLKGERVVIGRPRFLEPARGAKQVAQVVVAAG